MAHFNKASKVNLERINPRSVILEPVRSEDGLFRTTEKEVEMKIRSVAASDSL